MFPDYWTCAKVTPLLIIIEKKARARAIPVFPRRPRVLTIFSIITLFIGIISWSLRGGKSSAVGKSFHLK